MPSQTSQTSTAANTEAKTELTTAKVEYHFSTLPPEPIVRLTLSSNTGCVLLNNTDQTYCWDLKQNRAKPVVLPKKLSSAMTANLLLNADKLCMQVHGGGRTLNEPAKPKDDDTGWLCHTFQDKSIGNEANTLWQQEPVTWSRPWFNQFAIDNTLCRLTDNGQIECNASDLNQAKNLPAMYQLALGDHHACASLRQAPWLVCWGENSPNQLVSPTGFSAMPVKIAAGAQHYCVISADNDWSVWCWGGNAKGQAGVASFTDLVQPERVINGASKLALGQEHSCAVVQGQVWCWGDNSQHQLAANGLISLSKPVQVPELNEVRLLESHQNHSCVVTQATDLWCWGEGLPESGPSQIQFQLVERSVP